MEQIEFHVERVKCERCVKPGQLFGTVHYSGPPCLKCDGVAGVAVGAEGFWTCRGCGGREKMDRSGI